jgi:hypothetical protein
LFSDFDFDSSIVGAPFLARSLREKWDSRTLTPLFVIPTFCHFEPAPGEKSVRPESITTFSLGEVVERLDLRLFSVVQRFSAAITPDWQIVLRRRGTFGSAKRFSATACPSDASAHRSNHRTILGVKSEESRLPY